MTIEVVGVLVLVGLLSNYFTIYSYFSSLKLKQKLLESKVDCLLQHLNIEYDQFSAFSKEVKYHIENGKKVEAAKILRVNSGVGLKEAMEIVESLESALEK